MKSQEEHVNDRLDSVYGEMEVESVLQRARFQAVQQELHQERIKASAAPAAKPGPIKLGSISVEEAKLLCQQIEDEHIEVIDRQNNAIAVMQQESQDLRDQLAERIAELASVTNLLEQELGLKTEELEQMAAYRLDDRHRINELEARLHELKSHITDNNARRSGSLVALAAESRSPCPAEDGAKHVRRLPSSEALSTAETSCR